MGDETSSLEHLLEIMIFLAKSRVLIPISLFPELNCIIINEDLLLWAGKKLCRLEEQTFQSLSWRVNDTDMQRKFFSNSVPWRLVFPSLLRARHTGLGWMEGQQRGLSQKVTDLPASLATLGPPASPVPIERNKLKIKALAEISVPLGGLS